MEGNEKREGHNLGIPVKLVDGANLDNPEVVEDKSMEHIFYPEVKMGFGKARLWLQKFKDEDPDKLEPIGRSGVYIYNGEQLKEAKNLDEIQDLYSLGVQVNSKRRVRDIIATVDLFIEEQGRNFSALLRNESQEDEKGNHKNINETQLHSSQWSSLRRDIHLDIYEIYVPNDPVVLKKLNFVFRIRDAERVN